MGMLKRMKDMKDMVDANPSAVWLDLTKIS